MHEIISKYKLGDMEVIYQKGRNRKDYDAVGMLLIPAGQRKEEAGSFTTLI